MAVKDFRSQQEWVVTQLDKNGYISRNQCLRNYITRLSAIIYDLRQAGWDFATYYVATSGGSKDYKYELIKRP
jgi:hypothetical protein